jgi:outer membrane protein OmpA-like peptidoglycan-associated protein
MKKVLFSGILAVFFAFQLLAQQDTLFFDDFSSNKNSWTVKETEQNTSRIEGGNYIWQRKQTGYWTTSWAFPGINRDEFSIEARFRIEGSGSFGLMWGGLDYNNSFFFTVNNSGRGKSYLASREAISVLFDTIPLPGYKPDFNTLVIAKEKNWIYYRLNGEVIHEELFTGFFGNYFGFVFSDLVTVYIDHYLINHKINLVPGIKYSGKPENLGGNINTRSSELYPTVTPDGKGLFFQRVYDPENTGGTQDYTDIYYSDLGSDGRWKMAYNLKKPLNNTEANAVQSVTPDGNTLFLLHTYNADGTFKSGGLSVSNRAGTKWGVPTDVTIIDNYNLAEYNEFCMSNDKQLIIAAIQQNDTHGDRDLYVSFRLHGEVFSPPLNLGPVINSTAKEMSPFLAADNRTLYFSSEGHPGYGDHDIFLSRRLDDSWTSWSVPENLGKPINTDDWDAYYSIPASGEYAYFVSAKSGFGSSDVFRIKLPEMAKPTPVVLVRGKVLNQKDNTPLQAIISYFDLADPRISGAAMSNPATGDYQITLPSGKMYGFLASTPNFLSVSENIDLKDLDEYKELERNLYLVPIEIGETVRLNNIFFETAKWDLLPESYAELDKLVKILNDNPGMVININGHTDNVGDDQSNLTLSQKRAASVVTYLLGKGIVSGRLDSAGFGEAQPVAPNDTDEGRALNRRVEFVIVKM